MRYTTIIDISEIPVVYNNINARLTYLHLILKCGYTDITRDIFNRTIRRTANEIGISISAYRNALRTLERHGLIVKTQEGIRVKKWMAKEKITSRTQDTSGNDTSLSRLLNKQEKEADEYRKKVKVACEQCTIEELADWLQELQDGKRLRHHGVDLPTNEQTIQWLYSYIKFRQEHEKR